MLTYLHINKILWKGKPDMDIVCIVYNILSYYIISFITVSNCIPLSLNIKTPKAQLDIENMKKRSKRP